MKNLILLISLLLFTFAANADRYIIDGDTSYVYSLSPLEQHPNIAEIKSYLTGFELSGCYDCHLRPYDAEWTVQFGELYLTGIFSANRPYSSLKADLKKIFKVGEDKVRADWVTTEEWLPKGKIIGRLSLMTALYPAELHVFITRGVVTNAKRFDYPNSQNFFDNLGRYLPDFYTLVDWKKIPPLDSSEVEVTISFYGTSTGKVKDLKMLKNTGPSACGLETIRIFSEMPCFDSYRKGLPLFQHYYTSIDFTEELRRKYAH